MRRMTHTRQRHLPVVDAGRLVGLISIGDVVKHRLDALELETHVLRDVYLSRGYAYRIRVFAPIRVLERAVSQSSTRTAANTRMVSGRG